MVEKYGFIDADGDYISNTYGMFSKAGDILVDRVVSAAIDMGRDFDYVDAVLLHQVAPVHGEATDTAVREAVWDVMMEARNESEII
mgnify:CR=1 FL=1